MSLRGPRPHLLAAGNELQLDHAFGAQVHGYVAGQSLRGEGHIHAGAFAQRGLHFGATDDLREMRRADFFFALRNKNKIDGQFPAGAADGVQSGEEGRLPGLSD